MQYQDRLNWKSTIGYWALAKNNKFNLVQFFFYQKKRNEVAILMWLYNKNKAFLWPLGDGCISFSQDDIQTQDSV